MPGGVDPALIDSHPRASYGGVLTRTQAPRALSEHDLLLHPSYREQEGYPGAIIEAFQCGVPVIAARCGGVAELVEHEKSGLLVAPRDAAGGWLGCWGAYCGQGSVARHARFAMGTG